MKTTDQHRYDNPLIPVELESGPLGVRVTTSGLIPCHRMIRQVIAGGLITVFRLEANYSFEGGLEGVIDHEDLEQPSPVEMRWVGDEHEIWLMSENPRNPCRGEELIAGYLYNVLETALFGLARDANGYPLILSSNDELLVTHILLEAFRRQFGGAAHAEIAAFIGSPRGANIALAGLG